MIKNSERERGSKPNFSATPPTKRVIIIKIIETVKPPTMNLLEKNPILKMDWLRFLILRTLNNWVIAITAKAPALAFSKES